MPNRPDPAQFARLSYTFAAISAGILGLAFVLGLIPTDITKTASSMIIWLVLLTGSIGAFMGYAANADFKAQSAPDDLIRKARVGFRINLGALIVTLLMAVLAIALTFLARMGG